MAKNYGYKESVDLLKLWITLPKIYDKNRRKVQDKINTLGLDLKLDIKNAKNSQKTNLSFILQAGLKNKSDEEVLRLAIIDKNKEGDNKNLVDLIINCNALYVNIGALNDTYYKSTELSLPAIGLINGGNAASTIDQAQEVVMLVLGMLVDETKGVTIDPIKNGKTYDVDYSFTITFESLIDTVASLISGVDANLKTVLEPVVDGLLGMLDGLYIDVIAKTTGNTQIKVKKPAKGEPKYEYTDGTLIGWEVKATKGYNTYDVAVSGLTLKDTIPTVAIPANDKVFDVYFLKHEIKGTIDMKNNDGTVVSNYAYTINLDLSAENFIQSVIDCVNANSVMPLLNNMFKTNKGKMYINIDHVCGDDCGITHFNSKKSNGSILSVAFSPEDFGNSRVYVSMDLQTILPDSLLYALLGDMASMATSFIKDYQYQFSFDFLQYIDLVNARATNAPAGDSVSGSEGETPAGTQEDFYLLALKGINILVDGLISVQENQEFLITPASLIDLIGSINAIDIDTFYTLEKVINCLFPADKLCIKAQYAYNKPIEFNVLEKYSMYNESTKKDFGAEANANHKVITGEVEWEKDAAGNAKIYQGNTDKLNTTLYSEDGTYNTISYGQVSLLVDRDTKNKGGTVNIMFNDIEGNEIISRMNIIEIVGLKDNVYSPQNVKLVLCAGNNKSAGIGSSLNNLLFSLKGLSGLVAALGILKDVTVPEVVIDTVITISEVESVTWDQTKVEGITSEQVFDENKIYSNGDALSATHHLTIKFKNGEIVETEVKADNATNFVNSSNLVTAWDTFTLNFNAFGYSKDITVNMNGEFGYDEQTIPIVKTGDSVTYKISTSVTNNVTGANMSLDEYETNAAVKAFAEENNLEWTADSRTVLGSPKWDGCTITFTQTGTYVLTLKGKNLAQIKYTFVVVENEYNVTDKIYAGVTKEYTQFGEYALSKAAIEEIVNSVQLNPNITAKLGSSEDALSLLISFAKKGTYSIAVNTANGYVKVNFTISEATKSLSSQKLATDITINLKSTFTDINFNKEDILSAIEKFNAEYASKATLKFNDDEENPALIINALNTNGYTGYTINLVGTNGEIVVVTVKFSKKTVNKTGNTGDVITVTREDIGLDYTLEAVKPLVEAWNKNATNAGKITIAVSEDAQNPTFTITIVDDSKLGYSGAKFTLTDIFEIVIKKA